jgi:hypothetical protein
MKSIKRLLFAVTASLLLAAGLARAAESFDVVATNSQVQQVNDGNPGTSCVILQ